MKRSSKELRRYAKLALEGRYGIAIMGVLAAFGINLLGNLLAEKTGFSYLVFVPLLFFLPGVLLYLARFNEIKWNAILPQR